MAYLRKTVRRTAYKFYKANKRQDVTELPLDDDLLFSLPSKDSGPDEILIENEDFDLFRKALAILPKKDRQVLYLKYAADHNSQEIAELTGAPSAAAIRERLSRARCKVLAWRSERKLADERETLQNI